MDLTACVSHLGHVIKFDLLSAPVLPTDNHEDLIFSESEKQTVDLQATSFKFSSERRCFEEEMQTRTFAHGHEVGADGKIVLVKCMRESHTGLVLPCVLVQSRRSAEDFVTSLFLYSPSSNRIFVYGEVTTRHAILRDGVWLIDGPSACWRVDEMNGFLIAKKDAESGRFELNSFVDDINAKESTIMYCSLSPESNLHIIAISQIKAHAGDDSVEYRWISLISNFKQKHCFANSNHFVPDVYASIACCMLLMIPDQENIPLGEPETCGDCLPLQQSPAATPLENTAYVATSMKQLLKFKNGVFCKLVSIPFDDSIEIVAMETRGEKMLVVRSREGAVCVISSTSFQVIQEWKNISCLYVDDFLGNGREQLLMINPSKDSLHHQSFPEFILTDLDLCHVASSDKLLHDGKGQRSDEVQSAQTPQSLVTAMQALEAKVENGLTSLREQELSRKLKDRIISQSMENLAQMAAGVSNPVHGQPTLVHLCGTTPNHPSLAPPTPGSDTDGRLKVTSGWQRIIDEKWVTGCKVTNENQWAVSDVKLLVLSWKTSSSQEPVGCEGYVQHPVSRGTTVDCAEIESQESSLVPPSKRSKLEDMEAPSARDYAAASSASRPASRPAGRLSSPASLLMPGESCDAVAMTTIAEFLEGPVASRLLVLQWVNHQSPQREQSGTSRGRVMSVICGHVHLGAADAMGSKLAVKLPEIHPTLVKPTPQHLDHIAEGVLSRTDELAMDASQLSTSVRVTSRYTHLPNLHKVLFRDMGFQEVGGGQCLCNCTSGVLRGARVYLDNVRSNSAQLRVCTRDKRERMLFFHTLKSFLPVDVQFTMDTPTDCLDNAIKYSVTSMNNELQHMLRITDVACSTATGVNQHEKDGEESGETRMEMGDGSDNTSCEQKRLKRLREDFLKQQETAKSKDCTLVGSQAELLRLKLLELRENTDNAMAVLSRCI